jgi:hypothetical protein
MIKTLSAIAISAFIAAALFVLSGYASEVEVGQSAAFQRSNRRDVHVVDPGCAKQTWPDFLVPAREWRETRGAPCECRSRVSETSNRPRACLYLRPKG